MATLQVMTVVVMLAPLPIIYLTWRPINIDGRAGTGTSTCIKHLRQERDDRQIKYVSLALANEFWRVAHEIAIHIFITSLSRKVFTSGHYDYIFIDGNFNGWRELLHVFICLNRANPKVKFIVAGGFEHLLPLKDRIGQYIYQCSLALHELRRGKKH
jgi:hypothetical protein